jgi:YspA, cpYpsA-related SLOG family
MRVLVTGGRDYRDQRRVDEALDTIHAVTPIEVIIHGAATGADSLAADWAQRHRVPIDPFPADWENTDAMPCRIGVNRHGKRFNKLAGFNRNTRMVTELGTAGLCVVFPGGAGTQDCRAKALRAGIATLDVDG